MSLKREVIKGSLLCTLGEGVAYGASFVRNMILARLLTKADFGIAATFALVMGLLEFSAKLGVTQLVVRDREGDEPDFIAAAHMVQFVAAGLGSITIAACAVPLSVLFGIPEQRWAIVALALAPLLRGLEHLDVRRFERRLRFGPALMIEALPQAAIAFLAWPVASWLGDYRAVLVLLLLKGLATSVGSHLLAERRYRWRIHRAYIARVMRFGWPLLVSGFLMFGALQGDQFLVAANYTVTDLGPYAAAAALTMAPTFFFGRVFNSVMLPVLAQVQEKPTAFVERYRQVLAVMTLFAVVCSVGMILGGEAMMRLVYGAKYAGAGVLLGWLSAANAFRNLRLAPALAAIAGGDTKNQMIQNWWRVTALIPAAGLAMTQVPLWAIASTGLLGEGSACLVSFLRLKRRDGVPLSVSLVPAGWVFLSVGIAGALAILGFYQLPAILGLILAALASCVGAAVMTTALPELRREARGIWKYWRKSGWRGWLDDVREDKSKATI